MRIIIRIIILYLFLFGILFPQSQLHELISQREWKKISLLFADASHQVLPRYFKETTQIRFVTYNINQLTYKAKFKNYAEIGTITYEEKNGKYVNLKIKNQISPLFFIENQKKFAVKDKRIQLGDAELYFREGHFYLSQPFEQVIFFLGSWDFSITPSDEEEKFTLEYLYKNKTFSRTNSWGIFILKDKDFLNTLPQLEPTSEDNDHLSPYLNIYDNYFGIKIKQFNESWFLPFKEDDNLIIFEKDKNKYHLYDFNSTMIPDTQLRTSNRDEIILSYNSIKKTKIRLKNLDKIEQISLSLFYNPDSDFLSGTAILVFDNPSSFHILNLSKNLKIKASLDLDAKGLSVIRKENVYYFLGPPTNVLSFFYSGNISSDIQYTDIFKRQTLKIETIELDKFFVLSRVNNFYPNTNIDFAKSDVKISLPKNFNCLASGQLMESTADKRNSFIFSSKGSKGITIACGPFFRVKTVKSKIPIHLFSSDVAIKSTQFQIISKPGTKSKKWREKENLSKFFNFHKLKDAFDFLLQNYGNLDSTEINLLFRKGLHEGGLSNKDFIIFNYNPDSALSQRISRKSPILLSSDSTNHLIHELAHQWWGGMVSWSTYRDVWITEGFSQFSLLYYLEKRLSEKKFGKILKKIKKEIYNKNNSGPIIYGQRIINISDDYESYQSIVYNKAAFVLLMLKEMVGENDFLKRIQYALNKFKYQSIPTDEFIRILGRKNPDVFNFLKKWIYSRKIPQVFFKSSIKKNSLALEVRQKDTQFTFPLRLRIKTRKGTRYKIIQVTKKNQNFMFKEKSKIRSVQIDDLKTLVRIKKQ